MNPWNEMSPRERDALVATEVMGLTKFVLSSADLYRQDEFGFSIYDMYTQILPHYTTDIAAAWEVFEKVTELGAVFKAETPFWACYISTSDEVVKAYTAPEAICLASLRALGIEI
jgi:hypothetical protein